MVKLRTYLPYVLSAAALLVFVIYLCQNADRYRDLFDFSVGTLLILVGLALIFALINGFINYFFYRALKVQLTLNEGFGLAVVNTLANQLPFAGGLIAKGVYLKQRHRLAYTHYLSATMALYVCFVAVNGCLVLMVLGYWALVGGTKVSLFLVLGFSAMVASLASLWIPVDAFPLQGKIGKHLLRLAEGWRVLGQNVYLVGILSGFQVLATLVFAGRFWIAFHALSQDVTYTECLLFSSTTVLIRLVSIAPGSLGVREGIVAGVASLLGFEAGVSAVAVGLDRLVATSVIIVLGAIYTYVLSRKMAGDQGESSRDG